MIWAGRRGFWASAVCRCLWRYGILARKNSVIFLAGTHRQGATPNFSSPGPVSSRQNVQILAKLTIPRQNVQSPRHGEENIIIIPRQELLARKKSTFFLSLQEQIWFWTRGILATHQTVTTYPAKWCICNPTPRLRGFDSHRFLPHENLS